MLGGQGSRAGPTGEQGSPEEQLVSGWAERTRQLQA